MKTLIKIRYILLLILFGMTISCKKYETAPADNYGSEIDSTEITLDTIGTNLDTTDVTNTVAKDATVSGTDGSMQKSSSVKTDSTKTSNGK